MKIDWHDVEELAIAMLGLPEDSDSDAVEQALFDELEISFESFHKVVEKLAPMTAPAVAAITGEAFTGFVHDGAFLVRVPVSLSKGEGS